MHYTTVTMYELIGLTEEICDYSMDHILLSLLMYSENRSNETYFKCRLPDNQTDIPDKVIAIADGALWFMTNKELKSLQPMYLAQTVYMSLLRSTPSSLLHI